MVSQINADRECIVRTLLASCSKANKSEGSSPLASLGPLPSTCRMIQLLSPGSTTMKRKYLAFLVLPSLVGVGAYLLGSGGLVVLLRAWFTADPIIDVPTVIEIGEREQGKIAAVQFAVSNKGRARPFSSGTS